VVDGERLDDVLTALEDVARVELDRLQRIRQPPEKRLQPGEEVAEAFGP